jgi:large subunit ribosomal protein L10
VREFKDAGGLLLVSMGGLTVAESESLRGSMAKKGVKFLVVRNSLVRRVLKAQGYTFPEGAIAGNLAVAYGPAEAAIHAEKLVTTPENKKAGKLKLTAGVFDGSVLGARDAAALADVPDQDTLRAQIVGCIQGPSRSLAALLQALPGGMARVMQARADKPAPPGEPAPAQ